MYIAQKWQVTLECFWLLGISGIFGNTGETKANQRCLELVLETNLAIRWKRFWGFEALCGWSSVTLFLGTANVRVYKLCEVHRQPLRFLSSLCSWLSQQSGANMTWIKRTFPLSARHVNSMLHSEMIPYNVARTHLIGIDGTLDRVDSWVWNPDGRTLCLGKEFIWGDWHWKLWQVL